MGRSAQSHLSQGLLKVGAGCGGSCPEMPALRAGTGMPTDERAAAHLGWEEMPDLLRDEHGLH